MAIFAWRRCELPGRIALAVASIALLVCAGGTAIGAEKISAPAGFEDGPVLTCNMDRLDYAFAEVDADDATQAACRSESRTKLLAVTIGSGCIAAIVAFASQRRRSRQDAVASPSA
jgi:hypothetical protein